MVIISIICLYINFIIKKLYKAGWCMIISSTIIFRSSLAYSATNLSRNLCHHLPQPEKSSSAEKKKEIFLVMWTLFVYLKWKTIKSLVQKYESLRFYYCYVFQHLSKSIVCTLFKFKSLLTEKKWAWCIYFKNIEKYIKLYIIQVGQDQRILWSNSRYLHLVHCYFFRN